MKKVIFLLVVGSSLLFSKPFRSNVACVTVAKSGSALCLKAISLVINANRESFISNNFKRLQNDYRKSWRNHPAVNGIEIYCSHFLYKAKLQTFIESTSDIKYIFNIRDPRDVVFSLIPYLDNFPERAGFLGSNKKNHERWKNQSHFEKYLQALNGFTLHQYYTFYNLYAENYVNVLLVRFENLVGDKGGGSDDHQREEIRKIARFLEIELTENQIQVICESLFGGTKTFRKGLIGGYRDKSSIEHAEAFEESFKDLIVPLSKWYDFSN